MPCLRFSAPQDFLFGFRLVTTRSNMRKSRKVSSVTSPAIHLPSQPITHWRVLRISQRQRMVTDGRRCICCSDNTPTFSPQNHWQWRLNLFLARRNYNFLHRYYGCDMMDFTCVVFFHLGLADLRMRHVRRDAACFWLVKMIHVWLSAHMYVKGYTHAWHVTDIKVAVFKNYSVYPHFDIYLCLQSVFLRASSPLHSVLFS